MKSVHFQKSRDLESGVTLIEMMVVLVIIAVIAAMIVPNVMGRPDDARVSVAKGDLRAIGTALEFYRLDNQTYPTSLQGLQALVERPNTTPVPSNWNSNGYLVQFPLDPWGREYVYRAPGDARPFDLISLGADGATGGDGVNSDVVLNDRTAQK